MQMSLAKEYFGKGKLQAGPGGWGCPCCNPYGCHPRNMKHLARRHVRRKSKLAVRRQIKRELIEANG